MPSLSMRNFMITVSAVLLLTACSTARVAVKKDRLAGLKTLAVLPFRSTVADASVLKEAEESVRVTFLASGYRVVEREKIDQILKEKELAMQGLTDSKAIETGSLLGAEAVLLAEITAHSEKRETSEVALPAEGPGAYDSANDKGDGTFSRRDGVWHRKITKVTFEFQLLMRLVSTVDGETILSMTNSTPSQTYSTAEPFLIPADLSAYRNRVLSGMNTDLGKALKE